MVKSQVWMFSWSLSSFQRDWLNLDFAVLMYAAPLAKTVIHFLKIIGAKTNILYIKLPHWSTYIVAV